MHICSTQASLCSLTQPFGCSLDAFIVVVFSGLFQKKSFFSFIFLPSNLLNNNSTQWHRQKCAAFGFPSIGFFMGTYF